MLTLEKPNNLPGVQTEHPVRTYLSIHWHTPIVPLTPLQLELGNEQSVLLVQLVSVIGSSDVVGIAIVVGSMVVGSVVVMASVHMVVSSEVSPVVSSVAASVAPSVVSSVDIIVVVSGLVSMETFCVVVISVVVVSSKLVVDSESVSMVVVAVNDIGIISCQYKQYIVFHLY